MSKWRCQDKINAFQCVCQPGFKGRFCEITVSKCSIVQCQNGGICKDLPGGNFRCVCNRGFKGIFCQTKVNKCQYVHCRNGGRCQSLFGGNFKCVCKPGFSGRFCQTCKFLHVVTQNPKSNYDRNKKTVSYRKKIITLKI